MFAKLITVAKIQPHFRSVKVYTKVDTPPPGARSQPGRLFVAVRYKFVAENRESQHLGFGEYEKLARGGTTYSDRNSRAISVTRWMVALSSCFDARILYAS